MVRYMVCLCLLAGAPSTVLPQRSADVGAGIINFFLRNPKTADRMKPDERIALDIIADLMTTEGERQHELEYAARSRNQITINAQDGRQAQFVRDEAGRVFLLLDGVIYPISAELVTQSLAGESRRSASSVDQPSDPSSYLESLRTAYLATNSIANHISALFTYKWSRDLNGNGVAEVEEYRHIKRQFADNENFRIAIAYHSASPTRLELEIVDEYSGRIRWQSHHYDAVGATVFSKTVPSRFLTGGTYLIIARLVDRSSSHIYSTVSETVQMYEGNAQTKEISDWEEGARRNVSRSTPRGIFLYSSWVDHNGDGKYDHEEFTGLNRTSYSLSQDTLWVGVNFPQHFGEIILQSWRNQNILLGTSTSLYQRVDWQHSYPAHNSHADMDFMNMVRLNGPGVYRITVSFVEGGRYEKRLVVTP